MRGKAWDRAWRRWRGRGAVEIDLEPYRSLVRQVNVVGLELNHATDKEVRGRFDVLRSRVREGESPSALLAEAFALVRETAWRTLGQRPFDVQVMAGAALHQGRLVEMKTGEGKTLAAVMPTAMLALAAQGVHVLTFNEYLATRDARWMGPVFEALGLSVASVTAEMSLDDRRKAYAADVTYATAKQVGFDLLRDSLAFSHGSQVHRPFHAAIVDEADSILIDEARVPLVIAGPRDSPERDPRLIARVIAGLQQGTDWFVDEHARNANLSEAGAEAVEEALGCHNLHAEGNGQLLAEVNQALHARALLHRDVDYIVRDDRIELVDELTGRAVPDRRWPDGLQTALEAKEGLPIRQGGKILGSTTLQHLMSDYGHVCGMTATARASADELLESYGLRTVVIPENRRSQRIDLPDRIFSHQTAKQHALLHAVEKAHATGQPVLVGTASVEESARLAEDLQGRGIHCEVLNAMNDQEEARIIAEAGALRAVTISTNMAGRGTDIRLGGSQERDRDWVVSLGGLRVIGTNRHESRRIDDQLRGRAGRQGDPGITEFLVSLDDPLMERFDVRSLIPDTLIEANQSTPLTHRTIRAEVDRLQRIVEGQNQEIRTTLSRYSALLEKQRRAVQAWRSNVLAGEQPDLFARLAPEAYAQLARSGVSDHELDRFARTVLLDQIDNVWTEHLDFVSEVREGIHLVGIGGQDPLFEFHKQVNSAFGELRERVEDQAHQLLSSLSAEDLRNRVRELMTPSATWTYLVNDRVTSDLQQALFGHGSSAFSAAGALMTGPLLLFWAWRRRRGRSD